METDPESWVLWHDDSLLVVNKPAGLPSLPDGYQPTAPHLKSVLEPAFGPLWIVHRLDRDTSGVILLARSAEMHRALNTQFEKRQVTKIYHALVVGVPDWDEKVVRLPLRPNGDRKHRTVVDAQRGKPAETGLRVLEHFLRYSLVEATPHTGRTHQIRAHLAALGYPVAADPLYSGGGALFWSEPDSSLIEISQETTTHPVLERSALHARWLHLVHPLSGLPLSFEAPYPHDLNTVLVLLRQY